MFFKYGEEELTYLKSKDKKLAEVIDELGVLERVIIPDVFSALLHAITGQQISTKAHQTIWNRFMVKVPTITPEAVITVADHDLQAIGISFKKVGYIKNIAQKVIDKELLIDDFKNLTNEEVCEELVKLKGIGKWTAEMIMIFSMQRKDILSFGDLAIVKGMRMLYHHREITPEKFNKYKRRYSPYGSVASFYFWAIAGGAIPEMKDYAPKKRNKHQKNKNPE